jgi:hypothetical protein
MNAKHILTGTLLAFTLFTFVPGAWAQGGHDRRRIDAKSARSHILTGRGSNKSQSTKLTPSARKSGGDNSGSTLSMGKYRSEAPSPAAKAQSAPTKFHEITVQKAVDASSPN